MLLAGLMAIHVGAFAVWVAAGTAESLLEEGGKAASCRRWALGGMALCLLAGAAGMSLSYPFYRGEGWLKAKILFTLLAATVQLWRTFRRMAPAPYLKCLLFLTTAALLLSFVRPF